MIAVNRKHALLEETLIASIALTLIAAIVAVLFRLATGISPWPGVIAAEVLAFGWGLVLLVATSPSRRR